MSFLGWIIERPEPVPALPPGYVQRQAPALDSVEMVTSAFADWDGSESLLVAIDYMDAQGEESSRIVTVHEVYDQGGVMYFKGWCHLRQAFRCFRVDRVTMLANGATGEVCADAAAFFSRSVMLFKNGREADDRRTVALKAAKLSLKDELYVLHFIAHADGCAVEAERTVIAGYIDRRLGELDAGLDATGKRLLHEWSSCLMPAKRTMLCSIGRLQADQPRFRIVGQAVLDIVAADGKADPDELEAVSALVGHVKKKRRMT